MNPLPPQALGRRWHQEKYAQAIEALMRSAWQQGLKGVAVFRRGSRPGVVQPA